MNARFFSALALLIVCASGCVPNEAERPKEEDDIREAVFSYQFLHNASGRQQNAKVYFLSLHEGGKDPSDEFMKRFAGHTPEVKKFLNALKMMTFETCRQALRVLCFASQASGGSPHSE